MTWSCTGGQGQTWLRWLCSWVDNGKSFTRRWRDNIRRLGRLLLSDTNCWKCRCICAQVALRNRFWQRFIWRCFFDGCETKRRVDRVPSLLTWSRSATQRLWSVYWALNGMGQGVEALRGWGRNRGPCQSQGSPSDSCGGEVAGRSARLNSTQAAGSPQRSYRHRKQQPWWLFIQLKQIWKHTTYFNMEYMQIGCWNCFLSPGGLTGLSTWKNPPSNTTDSADWDTTCVCGSSELGAIFSAACCLAFMAAFTAARRDFAAALLPVGLTGAANGFWG